MRITGIKIDNFKSFGDKNNLIRFDSEDTIGLIGKNESGKSNTLLALKDIKFFDNSMRQDLFSKVNRINNKEVKISVNILFEDKDIREEYRNIEERESRIEFFVKDTSLYTCFDGFLKNVICADTELKNLSDEICRMPATNQIQANIFKDKVKKYDTTFIKFTNYESILSLNENRNSILNKFKEKIQEKYEYFKSILPSIICFENDMVLKNRYSIEDIRKNNDTKGLEILLQAIEYSKNDLIELLTITDSAVRKQLEIKLNKKLENFNIEFNNYYKTNKINLLFDMDSGIINFVVEDDILEDGTSITNLSERSDGLKWYISMFLQLYSSKKTHKYSLILLDEPGTSLHVIAQKKLLELLMQKGDYQIIYTTHSPFMIDIKNLESIRLVGKTKFTEIKNGLNSRNKETLTPILNAIGSSLNYNFGPQQNKLNLVVEGITDYLYITSVLEYFKVDEKLRPYILPCIGASSENRIVTILIGWGYNYKCLLDSDKPGRDEKKRLEKVVDNMDEHVYFISDVEGKTIESLLSDKIKNSLKNKEKTLMAKEFNSKILKNEIILDEETEENFKKLFTKIGVKV